MVNHSEKFTVHIFIDVAIDPAGCLWSLALPTGNKLFPRPNLRPKPYQYVGANLTEYELSAGPVHVATLYSYTAYRTMHASPFGLQP